MINEKPHTGFAHEGGRLTLDYPSQFKWWIGKLAAKGGCEVAVFVADKAWLKTRLQEKGFHAMISPWAREKGYAIDDLKRYLLAEVFGVTASAIDGKEILVEPHTSQLSKAKYSELIERTLDIAATKDDFWLEAPSDYKERKAKERKKAAKSAA